MYAIKKSLYLSVSAIILCGGGGSVANYDIIQNTHTTHISALASAPSYQIASITWLPEYDKNEEIWSKYIISKGTGGGHGKGDGCDSKYSLSKCPTNGDCEKCAFAKKYYFKGCKEGYKPKTPGSKNCILDCKPETCEEGFSVISNKDVHAEYKECNPGCNEPKQYKFLKCEDGYFLKDGKCVACEKTQPEGSCPDGTRFNDSTSCENKEGIKVGDCEDCLKTDCKGFFSCDGETQNGEGRTCPCGNKTYYEYCSECNKEYTSCPEGYELENGCTRNGTKYYDCVDCLDEESQKNPCKGLYTCRGGGREPKGESICTCGGTVKYYKECHVQETCLYNPRENVRGENSDENCNADTREYYESYLKTHEYYLVKSLCTKVDGTEMIAYHRCYSEDKNCAGNYAPAKGMLTCENDVGKGKSVECGGKTYFETCNCPYNSDKKMAAMKPSINENEGSCWTYTNKEFEQRKGLYLVKSLCSKLDGTEMLAVQFCNALEKDCTGHDAPAKGLMSCENDIGVGDVITECGGLSYYKTCQCPYTNDSDGIEENAGTCWVKDKEYFDKYLSNDGYYMVKPLCSKTDGTEMIGYYRCNNTHKDCNGNEPPARGLQKCPFGMAKRDDGGQVVDCGGMSFGTSCLAKCNYEFKEEDCTAQGKTFERKCHDNDDIWWGECK